MFSLIKFVRMQPFDDWEKWKEYISKPLKQGRKLAAIRMKSLINFSTMRRLKDQKVDGRPLVILPVRNEVVVVLPLARRDEERYQQMWVSRSCSVAPLDGVRCLFR